MLVCVSYTRNTVKILKVPIATDRRSTDISTYFNRVKQETLWQIKSEMCPPHTNIHHRVETLINEKAGC